MRRLLLGLLSLAFVGVAAPAFAANCLNTNQIPGEVRYDDGLGNCFRLTLDAAGNQNAGGLAPVVSASSAATSLIAKATPGVYYDGYCQATAAGRCILYDNATVPAAGALTPAKVLECAVVAANGQGGWQYNNFPRQTVAGIVILFSSSVDCNTYTVSSTAYIHASVR